MLSLLITKFRGHNGLKSISQELGGFKDYLRFGIGIGRPDDREQNVVAEYVLSNFQREELETLQNDVFSKIYGRLLKGDLEPDTIK